MSLGAAKKLWRRFFVIFETINTTMIDRMILQSSFMLFIFIANDAAAIPVQSLLLNDHSLNLTRANFVLPGQLDRKQYSQSVSDT